MNHLMRASMPVLLCAALLAGCGGGEATKRQPVVLASTQELQSASYVKYWDAKLPVRKGDRIEQAYLVDDNLYLVSDYGDLFAVHAEQGLFRWADRLTEPDYLVFPPKHLDADDGHGPLIVATSTKVVIYDRYSGDIIRSFVPPFPAGGSIVGDEHHLFAGSADGHVYCLIWDHPYGVEPIEKWRLLSGGPVLAAPIRKDDNNLYFASMGGYVVLCGAKNKSQGWEARLEDTVVAEMTVVGEDLLVASTDRSLYKFNRFTGTQRWRHRFQTPLIEQPLAFGGAVYQSGEGFGLTALDLATGEERWTRADALAFVAAGLDEIAVRTTANQIELLNPMTGETQRSFPMGSATVTAENLDNDAVYLVSPDGNILCARADGIPYLRKQQVEAATAYINRPPPPDIAPPERKSEPPPASEDPFRSRRDR